MIKSFLDIAKKTCSRIRDSFYWRKLWRENPEEWFIQRALKYGVKMGKNCRIMSLDFSSEAYLVELGDHVLIASHVKFITHEAGWVFSDDTHPEKNIFGAIKIGNNVSIGMNAIILPNTEIGDNCIIGAGSVVRGKIPANSVYVGNPGKVVMKLSLYEKTFFNHKNFFDLVIDGSRNDEDRKKRILTKHFYLD